KTMADIQLCVHHTAPAGQKIAIDIYVGIHSHRFFNKPLKNPHVALNIPNIIKELITVILLNIIIEQHTLDILFTLPNNVIIINCMINIKARM
ncbi:MAG: hypothetical protein Q4B70_17395, partial [Lachnospiraceae bacterium]|nr:hypothetical protein [Lachnospiraceae bacterium]